MNTVIRHVRVIDGKGAVFEDQNVLFNQEEIQKITSEEVAADQEIDGSGKSLLPGLIDCHVHLGCGILGETVPEEEQGLAIVLQMKECIRHGITTVRSMGTADDSDIKVRNLINSGYLKGCRILASGRGISITGGHGWRMNYECDTPAETRKAARKAIQAGADVLKMFATGGMGTKGSIPNVPQLSEEQMRVVCEEAERRGLLTAAHCTGLEGAKRAIRAGVRSIEHIQMDRETAQMMKERGSYYCPTIVTRYNIIHSTEPEYEFMRKKASPQDLERKKKAIELCLEYGVPICAGTDSIGSVCNNGLTRMGESLLTELGIYHEFGMSNMQVIESATSVAARMLRIEDETGSLEEGKCADMILVEGKPDRNLENLKELVMTVRAGEILYCRE